MTITATEEGVLKIYLGEEPTSTFKEIYGVEPSCITGRAEKLCHQYLEIAPPDHMLKGDKYRNKEISRDVWKGFAPEITSFHENRWNKTLLDAGYPRSTVFWLKIHARNRSRLLAAVDKQIDPGDHDLMENEVIWPLLTRVITEEMIGREAYKNCLKALVSAGYIASEKVFLNGEIVRRTNRKKDAANSPETLELLKEFLGHRLIQDIATQHGVTTAEVHALATNMCKQYTKTLPLDHPLRNTDKPIRRYEWREYTPEILGFFSKENSTANTPSQSFWRSLNARAIGGLKHFFGEDEMNPADHKKFEAQVILPLLKATYKELLETPNMGRKTLYVYANALCIAGYLDKPANFKAYPKHRAKAMCAHEKIWASKTHSKKDVGNIEALRHYFSNERTCNFEQKTGQRTVKNLSEKAQNLCKQYLSLMPSDHPLRGTLDSGKTIPRAKWKGFASEILFFYESKSNRRLIEDGYHPAMVFWLNLSAGSKRELRIENYDPSNYELLEVDVIKPLADKIINEGDYFLRIYRTRIYKNTFRALMEAGYIGEKTGVNENARTHSRDNKTTYTSAPIVFWENIRNPTRGLIHMVFPCSRPETPEQLTSTFIKDEIIAPLVQIDSGELLEWDGFTYRAIIEIANALVMAKYIERPQDFTAGADRILKQKKYPRRKNRKRHQRKESGTLDLQALNDASAQRDISYSLPEHPFFAKIYRIELKTTIYLNALLRGRMSEDRNAILPSRQSKDCVRVAPTLFFEVDLVDYLLNANIFQSGCGNLLGVDQKKSHLSKIGKTSTGSAVYTFSAIASYLRENPLGVYSGDDDRPTVRHKGVSGLQELASNLLSEHKSFWGSMLSGEVDPSIYVNRSILPIWTEIAIAEIYQYMLAVSKKYGLQAHDNATLRKEIMSAIKTYSVKQVCALVESEAKKLAVNAKEVACTPENKYLLADNIIHELKNTSSLPDIPEPEHWALLQDSIVAQVFFQDYLGMSKEKAREMCPREIGTSIQGLR